MLSIAAIARRDGVSKPAISRKVKQLVNDHGLVVERDGQGRVAAVNVAQYDELRGRYADPSKSQSPAAVPGDLNETYDEALRQRTWIEAERSRIRLAQEKGELVDTTELADALASRGADIARMIDRLVGRCDEMAAEVGRDGVHGLRVLMKRIVFELKTEIATALELVAVKRGSDDAKVEISA